MKLKYILSAALSAAVFGAAAGARWTIEETITEIPDQVDEINVLSGGYITTAWTTYAVSMGEDIFKRYEGPSYKYENGELRETAAPTPTPYVYEGPKEVISEEINDKYDIIRTRDALYNIRYYIADKNGKKVLPEEGNYGICNAYTDRYGRRVIVAAQNYRSDDVLLDGELNVLAVYKDITVYDNGMICVENDERVSNILDRDYREIIDTDKYSLTFTGQYEKLPSDTEVYTVHFDGDRVLINDSGEIVSNRYKYIYPIKNGFRAELSDSQLIILDTDGSVLVEKPHSDIGELDDGWLCYGDGYTEKYGFDGALLWSVEGRVNCLRDPSGKLMDMYASEKDGKYAFVSGDGELMSDYIYNMVYSDAYGLSDLDTEITVFYVHQGDRSFYIDTDMNEFSADSGVWYIAERFGSTRISDLGDTFIGELNGQYALIDKVKREYIIPYGEYSGLGYTGDRQYIIAEKADGSDLLDLYGNVLLESDERIWDAADIGGGLIRIRTGQNELKYRVIDETGENVLGRGYDIIERLDDETLIAKDGGELIAIKRINEPAVFNTDIRTEINGFEIPCFGVNDHVVVVAEYLGGYGFDVAWDAETETLNITRNQDYYEVDPVEIPDKGEAGTVYDNIVPTDTKVYYNGRRIGAYSINGRMLIMPKDLVTDGISCGYDNDKRLTSISVEGLENK